MMPMGCCNQCGESIGRMSANGIYAHDRKKMTQIQLIYGFPYTSTKSIVHIPICRTCMTNPNIPLIESNLSDEPNFLGFHTTFPNAVFERYEEEPGMRI